MVTVELYRRETGGDLVGFRAFGHAGYADKGSDIVCAAISALTTVTVLGIEERVGLSVHVEVDEETGFLHCTLAGEMADKDRWQRGQDLLETLAIGLREIEKEYMGHILVKEVAV